MHRHTSSDNKHFIMCFGELCYNDDRIPVMIDSYKSEQTQQGDSDKRTTDVISDVTADYLYLF